MNLFKKSLYIFLFFITACGFKPLYKKTDNFDKATQKIRKIEIPPVKNFDGVYGVHLRNSLYNKFNITGTKSTSKYVLDINFSHPNITTYTINNDGTTSSYLIEMTANFTLNNKKDYKTLLSKSVSTSGTYSIFKNQYATEKLKQNTIKLNTENIAEQIYFNIINYFNSQK